MGNCCVFFCCFAIFCKRTWRKKMCTSKFRQSLKPKVSIWNGSFGGGRRLANCSFKKETGQYSMYTQRLTPFTLDILTELLQAFGRQTGIQATYGAEVVKIEPHTLSTWLNCDMEHRRSTQTHAVNPALCAVRTPECRGFAGQPPKRWNCQENKQPTTRKSQEKQQVAPHTRFNINSANEPNKVQVCRAGRSDLTAPRWN